MPFEYGGCVFNLLDTPGHEDFSEDTYRTLTAVDRAVMVIDAAKGIEAQTLQAVRGLPPARHPDHHLHQQDGPRGPRPARAARRDREDAGARHRADDLADRQRPRASPASTTSPRNARAPARCATRRRCRSTARTSRRRRRCCPSTSARRWREELDARAATACRPFDLEAFRAGHLTPVFFGSALNNFGVRDLLDALGRLRAAAARRSRPTRALVAADRADDHRLRLQDPGQHGPEPPRPHRLRARLLGQVRRAA